MSGEITEHAGIMNFHDAEALDRWILSYLEQKRKEGPVVFLDSQLDGHSASTRSYIAANPVHSICLRDGMEYPHQSGEYAGPVDVSLSPDPAGRADNKRPDYQTLQRKNAWDILKTFRQTHRDWMFGWLAYDLKNDIEEFSSDRNDPVGLPDMFFFIPETVLNIDRKACTVTAIKGTLPDTPVSKKEHSAPSRMQERKFSCHPQYAQTKSHRQYTQSNNGRYPSHRSIRKYQTHLSPNRFFRIGPLVSGDGWKTYRDNVRRIKDHIVRGDTYEVNLTHQLKAVFQGDSLDLFTAMRKAGPVPFAAWLRYDDVEVCCASPERFLQRKGNRVWSQPIKGTSPRGTGREEDEQNIRKILKKEKNRAENVMIVDLVRNDLGRIALNGTVQTESLLEVQTFSTVHQLVSTITAELAPDTSSVEVLKACFPMGSMTGAPKIRTLQIIEELESYRRGLYSGAIGYMTPDDDFDFNVVIRTAIIKRKQLFYSVGGAITADSDPRDEWEESWLKAHALMKHPWQSFDTQAHD